jgi:hypothetical protein
MLVHVVQHQEIVRFQMLVGMLIMLVVTIGYGGNDRHCYPYSIAPFLAVKAVFACSEEQHVYEFL